MRSRSAGVAAVRSRYNCLSSISSSRPCGQMRHESLSITSASTSAPRCSPEARRPNSSFRSTSSVSCRRHACARISKVRRASSPMMPTSAGVARRRATISSGSIKGSWFASSLKKNSIMRGTMTEPRGMLGFRFTSEPAATPRTTTSSGSMVQRRTSISLSSSSSPPRTKCVGSPQKFSKRNTRAVVLIAVRPLPRISSRRAPSPAVIASRPSTTRTSG